MLGKEKMRLTTNGLYLNLVMVLPGYFIQLATLLLQALKCP